MATGDFFFPQTPRVIYAKNPLNEVICQIRFPTILRITSESPFAFQEAIRAEFPDYAEEVNALAPAGLPKAVVQLLSGSAMSKRHRFGSRDGKFSILLDGQALTFTTESYTNWDEFSGYVAMGYKAFCDEYTPTFVSRIGLRYQNLIAAPDAATADFRWNGYIRDELVGVSGDEPWRGSTFEYGSVLRCRLTAETDRLLFQYGLAEDEDEEGKWYFRLDFDYYVEQDVGPDDALSIIERLHRYSGPAFRWAIKDQLHDELGPVAADQI